MSERPISAKQVKFIAHLMAELNISEPGLCCHASRLSRGRRWPFASIEEFDAGSASWSIDQLLRKRSNPDSSWNPKPDASYERRMDMRRAAEQRERMVAA